ncbi:type II toxin-antitoxin system prevent-host-death family antitoxin [Leptospira bandrabouensis]|uniref:Antitoxin n=1 Tax=Leptospira bandrabouensis TaxID=2484903 RepID=A0A6H3NPN6_9LEPT|nr:type II toxin-antitoxin system prevent-host-death family antitoxin [Leptospira bandrabouensis]MCW7459733.1 type II toxin-antitoxin system prevent-host-death family antitoxin [Leptospira bandrabouensis]MCW7477154.1 type II toxin-antitoxin system prevent-host-death family antitoxin [Leptospira bandrabouensis]MCW7484836.1 type II toxin-antitoxin system prevent-host-death family antitoxin [Leptospira bandrabouensis]TGN09538.1 type II toxin-antitoxin system prevent-host-death family antitoxin [Le
MIYVGVRDLKAKLSEYLDKARLGDEVIVTEHGKPIARLIKEPSKQKTTIDKMYLLAEKGIIQLPSKEKKSKSAAPLTTKSKIPASETLLNDR